MTIQDIPALNAALNALATALMTAGFVFIRQARHAPVLGRKSGQGESDGTSFPQSRQLRSIRSIRRTQAAKSVAPGTVPGSEPA